jgi:hypothetical protein
MEESMGRQARARTGAAGTVDAGIVELRSYQTGAAGLSYLRTTSYRRQCMPPIKGAENQFAGFGSAGAGS